MDRVEQRPLLPGYNIHVHIVCTVHTEAVSRLYACITGIYYRFSASLNQKHLAHPSHRVLSHLRSERRKKKKEKAVHPENRDNLHGGHDRVPLYVLDVLAGLERGDCWAVWDSGTREDVSVGMGVVKGRIRVW